MVHEFVEQLKSVHVSNFLWLCLTQVNQSCDIKIEPKNDLQGQVIKFEREKHEHESSGNVKDKIEHFPAIVCLIIFVKRPYLFHEVFVLVFIFRDYHRVENE